MNQQKEHRVITLESSWKNHFLGYLISVLCIPLFGIGLIGLFIIWKRQHRDTYIFSNSKLTKRDNKYERSIDLVNIENIDITQNWLQQKMNVGDLIVHTSASSMMLNGIEEAENIKEILLRAIQSEKELQQEETVRKTKEPKYKPGSMERINYLTGLWQQGLLSEEDYEEELKHFE